MRLSEFLTFKFRPWTNVCVSEELVGKVKSELPDKAKQYKKEMQQMEAMKHIEEIREKLEAIDTFRKKQKEMKAKQVKVNVKEIRFGPQTDDHDYNFKLRHAMGFLQDGDKVKAYVFFKGRSILFKEQGEVLLLRFANDLEEYGKVEQMPVLEGKRMTIFISPKKGTGKKTTEKQPSQKQQQRAESEEQ